MGSAKSLISGPQRELFAGPIAVQVASSSARLEPEVSRGWGAEVSPNGHLEVVLLDAQTARLQQVMTETRRVAVNVTHPITLESYQLKGELVRLCEPDASARQEADRRIAQFLEVLASIGLIEGDMPGVAHPGPARRVIVEVREVFDQTPGAGAGRRIGAT